MVQRDRYSVLVPSRKWLLVGVALSTLAHLVVFGGYSLMREQIRQVVHRITFESPAPPPVFWKPPNAIG